MFLQFYFVTDTVQNILFIISAGLRKEVELLRPGPRGPKVLRHQMVQWCAGGTEYPRWWHRQWGQQQFCWFFKLDKMPCSVLPWQAAWQVILISLKSSKRCTGHKNLEIWDPTKISIFLVNPLTTKRRTVGVNGLKAVHLKLQTFAQQQPSKQFKICHCQKYFLFLLEKYLDLTNN